MPAENIQTKRRYLSIQDGKMCERLDENTVNRFNHLSGVHLINITFRKVEKEGKVIGEVLQLHLLDVADYFIVETWINSSYAKAFYQVMQSIDHTYDITIITDQKIKDGKKKPALFVKQDGLTLKWSYTKDHMLDCPALEISTGPDGKTIYDDTLQLMFFDEKLNQVILPALKAKPNPFAAHPVYENSGRPKVTEVTNPANEITEPSDDLPF